MTALGVLKSAGLHDIPITGQVVVWREISARSWPVDDIVAENGSTTQVLSKNGRSPAPDGHSSLLKIYQQDAATRAAQFAGMQQLAARVLCEVPGTLLAQDPPGRKTDIAIDHSEFTHLPPTAIAHVVAILRSEGAANIRRFEAELAHLPR